MFAIVDRVFPTSWPIGVEVGIIGVLLTVGLWWVGRILLMVPAVYIQTIRGLRDDAAAAAQSAATANAEFITFLQSTQVQVIEALTQSTNAINATAREMRAHTRRMVDMETKHEKRSDERHEVMMMVLSALTTAGPHTHRRDDQGAPR